MSALFNQTNITSGTSFATGGGSNTSNFPGGIFTSSIVGLSSINGVVYSVGGGSNFPSGIITPSISTLTSINGQAPVLDAGSNINITASGNVTTGGTGEATVILPISYKTPTSFAVLVTQTSSQPVVPPWAKVLDISSFQLNGDSNADISWFTIGTQ